MTQDHTNTVGSSRRKSLSSSSSRRNRSSNHLNTSQTNSSIIHYLNTYQILRSHSDNDVVHHHDQQQPSSSSSSSTDHRDENDEKDENHLEDDQQLGHRPSPSSLNDTPAAADDMDEFLHSSSSLSSNAAAAAAAIQQLDHLNILLIGEKGAGKSSLLSTFHRALHQNYGLMPISGVGNTRTMSFTKKKTGYYLNTGHTIKGYDTRGLESMLHEELEQVKAIRDGRTRDDVEIVQKPYASWTLWDHLYSIMSRNPAAILDPDCLNGRGRGEASIGDVPHCVIFVVPANQRRIPGELEDFVNLFVEYGYQPLFAVTKIDCHGAEEGDLYAATHLYDCKKEELINTFDLAFDKVKPIQNYTQWDRREVSVENLALDLLSRAVEVAESFIQNWEEKQFRGHSLWSSWRNDFCGIQ